VVVIASTQEETSRHVEDEQEAGCREIHRII